MPEPTGSPRGALCGYGPSVPLVLRKLLSSLNLRAHHWQPIRSERQQGAGPDPSATGLGAALRPSDLPTKLVWGLGNGIADPVLIASKLAAATS